MIKKLLAAICEVYVYNPVSMAETQRLLEASVLYAKELYDTVVHTDALLFITECKKFCMPSWSAVKKIITTPLVLDGHNIYEAKELEEYGFVYHYVGR